MPIIDTSTAHAVAPDPETRSWPASRTRLRAAAADRLSTAAIRFSESIPPAVQDRLDRADVYCTLAPMRLAIARARFQVRAFGYVREHRSTRLLAWAAAIDALALTVRTISHRIPPGADTEPAEQLTNTAALLRAIAETERVRHAARLDPADELRRTPATPEIEAAAAAQLDQLCHPAPNVDGRSSLLSQLATQLYPILGPAVLVLRDLT